MTAYQLCIIAAGVYFLNGQITGVWKYLAMRNSQEGFAHPYIDIAHRTSLMYSFAAMLLAVFVTLSQLDHQLELLAVFVTLSQLDHQLELLAIVMLLAYFTMSIASYMYHGWVKKTDNQLKSPQASIKFFMWSLIVAEIGGFLVLFYGVILAVLS